MSTQIESAGVQKNGLLIDDLGRAEVSASAVTEDRDINKTDGRVWTLDIPATTPVGVNDYFFYFENTGSDTYLFTDFRFIAGAATLLDIDCVTGTAVDAASTVISPLSRNTGKIPTMTANTIYGTNITGLTDKGRLFLMQIEAAAKMEHLKTSSGIIVEPGGAIAIQSSVATPLQGTVSVYKVE